MEFDFLLWLIGYSCLLFGNICLLQAIKFQRLRYELLLDIIREANRMAYAAGWLHAYQDLGVSGSRRLTESSDSELKIESFSDIV